MTEPSGAGLSPEAGLPADGDAGRNETASPTGATDSSARWRADTYHAPRIERPAAIRRVRRGCWLLVIVLLLICCVLSAWLTDSILDLRAITTGG